MVTPIERLSESDRVIVQECLRAAVEGPFFPDWEFHSLFGLTRDEVRAVFEAWPETSDADVQDLAVSNALNNLVGYPHRRWDAWRQFISARPEEVARTLSLWLDEEAFDSSDRGYFDRMK